MIETKTCKKCSAQWQGQAKTCPECGALAAPRSLAQWREMARAHPQGKLIAGLAAAVVVVMAGLGAALSGMKEPLAPAMAVDKLLMSDLSWSADGSSASFKVKNENAYPLTDLLVYCERLGPTGATLGTGEAILPGKIEKKAQRQYRSIELGKAPKGTAKTDCGVIQARKESQ